LALVTLAFTFVVGTIVLNTPSTEARDLSQRRCRARNRPHGRVVLYYMGLALALVTVAAAFGIFHSKFGAGLFAIHDDEDVAEVLGVPTFWAISSRRILGFMRLWQAWRAASMRCLSPT
jgi:branched-chain amino acid transport system permease protein